MENTNKITILLPNENPIQPRACGGGIGSFGGTAIK